MAKRLKHAEGSTSDMQRRIDELTVQLNSAGGDNQRLQAELARLRAAVQELQDKNDALTRENKQLSGAFLRCPRPSGYRPSTQLSYVNQGLI